MVFNYPEWMDYAILKDGVYVLGEDVPKYIKEEYEEYQRALDEQFDTKTVIIEDTTQ